MLFAKNIALLNFAHHILVILIVFMNFGFIQFSRAQVNPIYEFRGVWVATVSNIDWPSAKNLPVETQKAEFIKLLDAFKKAGLNAVLVQVRPAADAFYPSDLEPWSEFLSGKQGKSPGTDYDPLAFMIEESHKRGLEFHAWCNPYRAVNHINNTVLASNSPVLLHPEWFVTYGDRKIFNPGLPEVREHVCKVTADLVSRYDIDGIHFDDYFYPYRIAGKEFPDEATFKNYGNGLNKDDWRRSNTDSIIKMISSTIKKIKPHVKFGISPFGVWRNKDKDPDGSATRAGQTNYDDLYADVIKWQREGFIDYLAPQLYWECNHKLCAFDTLVDWWAKHNFGRHLYVGHAIYRAGENTAWKNPNELPAQISKSRNNPNISGSIYYSAKFFKRNPNGWCDSLRLNYYKFPALPPPMTWIDSIPPEAPHIQIFEFKEIAQIDYEGIESIKGFALFSSDNQQKINLKMIRFIPSSKEIQLNFQEFPHNEFPILWIASVDRNNNLSEKIIITR